MAGITSSDGHWYVVFKYRGIKVKESLTTTSRTEAERVKKKIERALRDGTFNFLNFFPNSRKLALFGLTKGGLPVTLGEYAEVWLEKKRHLVAYEWYAGTIRNHILPAAIAKRPLAEITKSELELFVADLREVTGPRAVNAAISRLRTMFSDAFYDEAIDKDPMLRIENVRQGRPKIDPWTIDEVAQLLAACDKGGGRALLTILFFTGMRPNEALALQWQDIDWKRRLITVARTNGRTGIHLPKTTGSERDVAMLDVVYAALQEQRSRSQLRSQAGWVFPSEADTPIMLANFRDRTWKEIVRRSGLKYRTLYQTRHTFATILLGYESVQWVAAQLGHTSTQMVTQRYVKWIRTPASRAAGVANEEIAQAISGNGRKAELERAPVCWL